MENMGHWALYANESLWKETRTKQMSSSKNFTSFNHGNSKNGMFRAWQQFSATSFVSELLQLVSKHTRILAPSSCRTVGGIADIFQLDFFI